MPWRADGGGRDNLTPGEGASLQQGLELLAQWGSVSAGVLRNQGLGQIQLVRMVLLGLCLYFGTNEGHWVEVVEGIDWV